MHDELISQLQYEQYKNTQQSNQCPLYCSNHGICQPNNECLCDIQYEGVGCQLKKCPHVCQNGGYCKDGKCQCLKIFTNDDCSLFYNQEICIYLNNCNHNGLCQKQKCLCDNGYFGDDCSLKYCQQECKKNSICDFQSGKCLCKSNNQFGPDCSLLKCKNDCNNNGRCNYNSGICDCDNGWGLKDDCSERECLFLCQNNGYCKDGKCICPEGWTGKSCEIKDCLQNCTNQGICINGQCKCLEGFMGHQCQFKICPNLCNYHGNCHNQECLCDLGYSGIDCSEKICPSINGTLCSNNGICSQSKKICECKQGFTGINCEIKKCKNNCNYQGICKEGNCLCNSLFTGDECQYSQCPQNCNGENGKCQQDHTCLCNLGWTGKACNIRNVFHGIVLQGNSVQCYKGYEGFACEILSCKKQCIHGSCFQGICVYLSQLLYSKFYRCQNNYTGEFCDITKCQTNCNFNGICKQNGKCQCNYGWEGENCDNKILLHGIIFPNNSYQCNKGYTGEFCDKKLCIPPCSNHGICNFTLGKCQCFDKWAGKTCRKKSCFYSCNFHGKCSVKGKCICNSGYNGKYCQYRVIKNGIINQLKQSECLNGWKGDGCDIPNCMNYCFNRGICSNDILPNFKNYISNKMSLIDKIKYAFFLSNRTLIKQIQQIQNNKKRNLIQPFCLCQDGFQGESCQNLVCPANCNGNGKCLKNGKCLCKLGYQGANCSQRYVNPNFGKIINGKVECFENKRGPTCEFIKCFKKCHKNSFCNKHGQVLLSIYSKYYQKKCICKKNYYGKLCQKRKCLHNCNLNGYCDFKSLTCKCKNGFKGKLCQIRYVKNGDVQVVPIFEIKNYKKSNSLQIYIERFSLNNSLIYKITCKRQYFGQKLCDKMFCPYNCLNTFNRMNKCNFKNGKCNCMYGYTGKYCQIDIRPCINNNNINNLCNSNGICQIHNLSQSIKQHKQIKYINLLQVGKCKCNQGYQGNYCQDLIILNGLIQYDSNGNSFIKCNKNWEGNQCDILKCPFNCSNRGICYNGTCNCLSNQYTGQYCEIETCLDDCSQNGQCINNFCHCYEGWGGNNCNVQICPGLEQALDNLINQKNQIQKFEIEFHLNSFKHLMCSGHGQCSSIFSNACQCEQNYFGFDCSHKKCEENKCKNGNCLEGICYCGLGYYGENCDKQICKDNCNSRGQCQHNGKCKCNKGFRGNYCENQYCINNCNGRGKCLNSVNDSFSEFCQCVQPFFGISCEFKNCLQNCSQNGVCNLKLGICNCKNGYIGPDCQTRTCLNQCQNNGTCGKNGECICKEQYYGEFCQYYRCPNDCNYKQNKGICISNFQELKQINQSSFNNQLMLQNLNQQELLQNQFEKNELISFIDKLFYQQYNYTHQNDYFLQSLVSQDIFNNLNIFQKFNQQQCLCQEKYIGEDCSLLKCTENCNFRGVCLQSVNKSSSQCACNQGFEGEYCQFKSCINNCNGNGICINEKCICNNGFKGPYCQYQEQNCQYQALTQNKQCNGNGICSKNGICNCFNGFLGKLCEKIECPNNCTSIKQGKCDQSKGVCLCINNYSGISCNISMNLNQCSNHGIYDLELKKCICNQNYYGIDCSQQENCFQKCLNGQKCINNKCHCNSNFYGPNCQFKKCLNNCQFKGKCMNGACFCFPGYGGADCSIEYCKNNCNGQGKCISTIDNKFQCNCNHMFSGEHCQTPQCFNNCTDIFHGTCVKQNKETLIYINSTLQIYSQYQCKCNANFEGTDCSIKKCQEECLKLNNGICQNGICICKPFFTGINCERKACPNQCSGNGYCLENGECKCINNFYGQDCSKKDCPNNCSGHGKCKGPPYYSCLCDQGFKGKSCEKLTCPHHCQIPHQICKDKSKNFLIENYSSQLIKQMIEQNFKNFPKCECNSNRYGNMCQYKKCPNQCFNRGECNNKLGVCVKCEFGYEGEYCQINKLNCLSNCSQNGQCIYEKVLLQLDQKLQLYEEKGKCKCKKGYQGEYCNEKICQKNCSNHGICNQGKCFCEQRFFGKNCQLKKCKVQCKNGGKCDYKNGLCQCQLGFNNIDCSQPTCSSKCFAHGYCFQGVCKCEEGFQGTNCEISDCSKFGCFNRGICNTEKGICQCDNSFFGNLCQFKDCGQVQCEQLGTTCNYITGLCECKNKELTIQTKSNQNCLKCKNDCNNQGVCVKGECICYPEYQGLFCNKKLLSIIKVKCHRNCIQQCINNCLMYTNQQSIYSSLDEQCFVLCNKNCFNACQENSKLQSDSNINKDSQQYKYNPILISSQNLNQTRLTQFDFDKNIQFYSQNE